MIVKQTGLHAGYSTDMQRQDSCKVSNAPRRSAVASGVVLAVLAATTMAMSSMLPLVGMFTCDKTRPTENELRTESPKDLQDSVLTELGAFQAEMEGFVPPFFHNLHHSKQFAPNPFPDKELTQSGWNSSFPVVPGCGGCRPGQIRDKSVDDISWATTSSRMTVTVLRRPRRRRRIVIYTRYSSDQQRPESCADQEREVRAALARLDIDMADALIIYDEGESGTKTDREKFEQLEVMVLQDEVSILAVDDQSRLSRADNVSDFIKDLVFHGGRFISTGEGIDTTQTGWELRVKVMELHNSHTIRELAHRVRRGQEGRVRDDGSAGDLPFGYESFYLDANWAEMLRRRGPKPKKGVRINETETKWVRQIFTWFVIDCWSIGKIARELTQLAVPKGTRATTKGWHHQQVHRILCNSKYIGQWPWGLTTTLRNSSGKKKQVPVPIDKQVVRDRPDLRIIEQEVWDKAQKRLAELKDIYGLKDGQKPRGPQCHAANVYPVALLANLLHCGGRDPEGHPCGARLWLHGSGAKKHYRCPNAIKGLCDMTCQVPVARADTALIGFFDKLVIGWPEWMQAALTAMRETIAAAANRLPQELEADRKQLALLDKQINNLVAALADGTLDSPAVKQKLVIAEQDAAALRCRLAQAEKAAAIPQAMPEDAWVKVQFADLLALLQSEAGAAPRLLRELLGTVTANAVISPGKRRGYPQLRFRIQAFAALRAVLAKRVGERFLDLLVVQPDEVEASPEIQLDLGEPSPMERWAPKIAELRAQNVKWEEIRRITGLGSGPAYLAWKRWTDAQKPHGEAG